MSRRNSKKTRIHAVEVSATPSGPAATTLDIFDVKPPAKASAKAEETPPRATSARQTSSMLVAADRLAPAVKALGWLVKPHLNIRISNPSRDSLCLEFGSPDGCRAKLTLLDLVSRGGPAPQHPDVVVNAAAFVKAVKGLSGDISLQLAGDTFNVLDEAGETRLSLTTQPLGKSDGFVGSQVDSSALVESLVAEWAFTYAAYCGDSVHVIGRAVAGVGGGAMHVAQLPVACPGPTGGFTVAPQWVQCWSAMTDALGNGNKLPVALVYHSNPATLRISWTTANAGFVCETPVTSGVDFTKLYPQSGAAIVIDPALTMALTSMPEENVLLRFVANKVQVIGDARTVAHEILAIRADTLGEFAVGVNRKALLAAVDVPDLSVSFVPGLVEQHAKPFVITQDGLVKRQAVLMPVANMGHAAKPIAPVMNPTVGSVRLGAAPAGAPRRSRKATAEMVNEVDRLRAENKALRSKQMSLFAFEPVRK